MSELSPFQHSYKEQTVVQITVDQQKMNHDEDMVVEYPLQDVPLPSYLTISGIQPVSTFFASFFIYY
jgi:hypothetical protein